VLRETLARADAMACATEQQLERYTWRADYEDDDEDAEDDRRLDHLAHLVAATKESVRAALYASGQVADELAKRRKDA
jgi:hypothetical protein